jgi:hypothetical protein
VQYIDLDVVVMASPGTYEATSEGPLEPDIEASVSIPASGERGGLERSLDEELVENSATTLRPRVGDEASVEGPNDSAPSLVLSRSSPATPPRRSSRDDGPPDSTAASSPPRMSDSPTATYRLPDSLRKRRRGSGQRILWRDSSEGRSPSPPGDGGSDEWVHVRTLEWEEQLAAFWTLLYPNQPRSVVPLAAAAQGPPLRSWYDDVVRCIVRPHSCSLAHCMRHGMLSSRSLKRQRRGERRDDLSDESIGAQKVLQWGSNSAVEFNGQTPALDLFHLSPATVELRFPAALDGYEELHPVDEEMMQLTKENSAILAAWEGFDDSSSESSIGSNDDDESHCFEDTEDDEDYRPPARRQATARNLRRASGIFTPAPFLASTSPDPMPPSSHEVMSPFDKLSLTSPVKGPVQARTSFEEHAFTTVPLPLVAKRVHKEMPNTQHDSAIPFVLSMDEERGTKFPKQRALVYTNRRKAESAVSIDPFASPTWQQKVRRTIVWEAKTKRHAHSYAIVVSH